MQEEEEPLTLAPTCDFSHARKRRPSSWRLCVRHLEGAPFLVAPMLNFVKRRPTLWRLCYFMVPREWAPMFTLCLILGHIRAQRTQRFFDSLAIEYSFQSSLCVFFSVFPLCARFLQLHVFFSLFSLCAGFLHLQV